MRVVAPYISISPYRESMAQKSRVLDDLNEWLDRLKKQARENVSYGEIRRRPLICGCILIEKTRDCGPKL